MSFPVKRSSSNEELNVLFVVSDEVKTQNEAKQEEVKKVEGSTTTPYIYDQVVDGVKNWGSWLWATAVGDYSGPQKVMKDCFEDKKKSPGQKIDYLMAHWKSLGLSGDALRQHIGGLIYEGEKEVFKEEFNPIFSMMTKLDLGGLDTFVKALTNPTEGNGERILSVLREALRLDSAYLADKTMEKMGSSLPIEQKAVHFLLLLEHPKTSDEMARACYAKIPETEKAYIGEVKVDLEKMNKAELHTIVQKKIDPLAVLQVMQSFQGEGFEETLFHMHKDILAKEHHQPLLNQQVIVKEEKDGKKDQTGESDLAASLKPGTDVEYILWVFPNVKKNNFEKNNNPQPEAQPKPCGDVATEALTRYIAELKKVRAQEEKK